MATDVETRRTGHPVVVAVLLCYVAVEVSQIGDVAIAHGWPSPWAATQIAAAGALVLARWQGWLRFAWSPILTAAALVVAAQAASVATAADPRVALDTVTQSARDLLTLALVLTLLHTTNAYRITVVVATGVLTTLASLSVAQQLLGGNIEFGGLALLVDEGAAGATTARHAGPIGDPNFWARLLVLFAPFAAALAITSSSRRRRVLWGGSIAVLLAGVWLAQSRGGMIAAIVATVVMLGMAGPRYRRLLAITPVILLAVFLLPATGSRLATLWDAKAASTGEAEESLVLRERTQEAGLLMIADHPVLGVGAGNYQLVVPAYEGEIDGAHLGQRDEGIAAHNAFLEAAAETGLVGLAAWLILLGAIAVRAGHVWLVTRPSAGRRASAEHLLAAAALAGLAGWITASTVLHVRQFRALLVFAGIVAALDLYATRATTADTGRAVGPRRSRLRRPAVVAVALVAVVGVVPVGMTLAAAPTWQAIATVSIVPRQRGDAGLAAYEYDLLSRPGLMNTLALVMTDASLMRTTSEVAGIESQDVDVSVDVSSTLAVIHVRLGGSERDVDTLLPEFVAAGASAVNDLGLPFVAAVVSVDAADEIEVSPLAWTVVFTAAAGMVICGAFVAMRSLSRGHG